MNRFNILVANNENVLLSTTSSPFVSHALEIDYPLKSRKCMLSVLGSSNGLVLLLIIAPYDNLCIWNPATREYKRVPDSGDSESDSHGFGFDCKNDDYKVIKIASSDPNEEVSEASVYSLASNSWKELGSTSYYFPLGTNKGLLLNGVLHWIVSSVLVCFDISDEMFRDVRLPYSSSDGVRALSTLDLGVWEGKLCLFQKNHMENPTVCMHQNDHVEVWTMMDNKWSKHLKITAHMTDMSYGRPIQTLQNGEILIEGRPGVEECIDPAEEWIDMILYDPKLERVGTLKIYGLPEDSNVDTYIETLVPLNSGTYVNKTRTNKYITRKKRNRY
ncbi:F-box/kelch-repeat protein At3g06240-like [Papaver somniferum]|uniref:F-box/kelch-repeat protein At3g06240-like n=1 Tax=Papaver somniferum TaxID=3469 RepID=UPI000E705AE8|nr:F-box/kelch-repeat protein At3g06240-like [Papaver somniferum]XP_026382864.1 F-box/kelch-repeat protein At3g06240-like [Papaver somniferum]XP_026382872.1 F-box/kelch-repeat protein At3g06240-like [Papaver somniferum]XP_026382877.1 F-box/kelch-repeat protein At3g06240-like [Papaver somniferum]